MKKKTIKKEMKLEDLASVMMKGFERSDKRTDDLAAMVARGFERADSRFEKIEKNLETFKKETSENFIKVRHDILGLHDRFVSKNEFDKFVSRFNVLEAKVKGKK